MALPLCLGIALASGAPIYAGLLSGIIGGLVVSFISGSQLAVSGPAAGLTTLVAASIISLGDYRIFTFCDYYGLFQLLLGILKLGVIEIIFFLVIKECVAVGMILIFKQIPLVLGHDQPDFGRGYYSFVFQIPDGQFKKPPISMFRESILISVLSLIILIILQSPWQKK